MSLFGFDVGNTSLSLSSGSAATNIASVCLSYDTYGRYMQHKHTNSVIMQHSMLNQINGTNCITNEMSCYNASAQWSTCLRLLCNSITTNCSSAGSTVSGPQLHPKLSQFRTSAETRLLAVPTPALQNSSVSVQLDHLHIVHFQRQPGDGRSGAHCERELGLAHHVGPHVRLGRHLHDAKAFVILGDVHAHHLQQATHPLWHCNNCDLHLNADICWQLVVRQNVRSKAL